MTRSHVGSLLLLGVVFHAIYVLSIFDIYFTSPIVPHIESLSYATHSSSTSGTSTSTQGDPSLRPPAKRLVVFVADGCRADKFFESNQTHLDNRDAPERRVSFLRDVIERRGSWGVSHTRVPTESRPGHVALFAGMYEDVSAVTKGWQDNPVDFDSIFNQSQHAWLFGSPDIVPMFARRVAHATELHYSHEEEDFASKDASSLDVWVYDHLAHLLMVQAPQNDTLRAQLHSSQVVFFCHFLGIDTNGHAHRPNSKDYLNNIALVDELVEKTSRLIEEFYDFDGKTAFVFTADHGMSNKGAHGDGDPSNTRTPLVVWGAGVSKPEPLAMGEQEQDQIELPTQSKSQVTAQLIAQQDQETLAFSQWGLSHLKRKDVMQADVAPLISSLLGLPYPRNSVGVLPFTFLAKGKYRTKAVVSNAKQLFLHAKKKEHEKQAKTMFLFTPFLKFRDILPQLILEMDKKWQNNQYLDAEKQAQQVISICLETLDYFQRYDWFFLFSVIVCGYIGWILYLAVVYFAPQTTKKDFDGLKQLYFASCETKFLLVVFVVTVFLSLESSPWTYFVYAAFPLVFWNAVWTHRRVLVLAATSSATSTTTSGGWRKKTTQWVQTAWMVVSLELVVLGYNHRWIFGVVFALLALWPLVESDQATMASTSTASTRRTASPWWWWSLACLVISVFPLLPAEYGEHTALVVVGGLVLMALARTLATSATRLRVLPLLGSLIAVHLTMDFLSHKTKPPQLLTLANWVLALSPIAWQLLAGGGRSQSHKSSSSSSQREQLVEISLALAPSFVLLSISYEVLFYASLTFLLLCWQDMEDQQDFLHQTSTWNDLRRAFFFLLLIKIAFFGTGNVASMSSFEISSTYRFVTVFAPFLMGALLVIKILIPFLLVASTFVMIVQQPRRRRSHGHGDGHDSQHAQQDSSSRYFVLVIAMSDLLALQFLFLVQNEGSWKEIGNSISMFGIVNAQIVFVPLLFGLATLLIGRQRNSTKNTSQRDWKAHKSA